MRSTQFQSLCPCVLTIKRATVKSTGIALLSLFLQKILRRDPSIFTAPFEMPSLLREIQRNALSRHTRRPFPCLKRGIGKAGQRNPRAAQWDGMRSGRHQYYPFWLFQNIFGVKRVDPYFMTRQKRSVRPLNRFLLL